MTEPNKQKKDGFIENLLEIARVLFNKVSKTLDHVLFQKTGSLLISLVLSLIICLSTNYQDIQSRLFTDQGASVEVRDVPVQIIVDQQKYTVDGIPSDVDVVLTGDATSIQVFRQQGDLKVVADVSSAAEGRNIIDLTIPNLPSDIDATLTPATAEATVSRKVTKQFTLQSELLIGPGQTMSDFEIASMDRSTVEIRASMDRLNSIRTVKAIVDVTGQTADFSTEASIAAYDSKGNKVAVEIEPASVMVRVKKKQVTEN